MPYHVEWYKEPEVVFIKLSGKLTQEDLSGFAAEYIALSRTVPDIKVVALIDVTEVESAPPINIIVQEIRELIDAFPYQDMNVMYGANKFVRYLAEMLYRFASPRVRLLNTREEAIAFIMEVLEAKKTAAHDTPPQ